MVMNHLDLYIGIYKQYQKEYYNMPIIKNKLNNFVKTMLGSNRVKKSVDFVENFIEEKKKELRRNKNVVQKK
jgi:hypothetical protein